MSNKVLESTNNWFKANKLNLSLDKCIYTVFKLAPNKTSFSNYDLCLDGVKLNRVKTTKYLGVIIDEDLNWQEHILYVKNKLIKFCSIFYKLRLKIPHHVLKKLYFALVHPHLVYCVEIYANTYLKYLDPLIKLNNKILRILQNCKMDHPVKKLYISYNTLPVPQLHDFYISILMHRYKFCKEKLPVSFQNYFIENSEIHGHNTRQTGMFHYDRKKTARGQRSIKFKGCKNWNAVPAMIRLYRGIHTFKKKLKLFLLHNAV